MFYALLPVKSPGEAADCVTDSQAAICFHPRMKTEPGHREFLCTFRIKRCCLTVYDTMANHIALSSISIKHHNNVKKVL